MLDVLGQDLDQARAALEAQGYRVEVVETRSPRRVTLSGPLRVVRRRDRADGVVELVVTHARSDPVREPRGG